MAASHHQSEATIRGARMLRTALGPAIAGFLEDPGVVEVMLNPDGRLWIDRLSEGLSDTGERLSPADGERIVRLVAHHVGAEVHPGSPRVSAELPETGERFEGLLPPVVTAPTFAVRKPAVAVFTLADYVAAGIMSADQAETLRLAVVDRRNILVAGGTSTGKTTLTNALLAEVARTDDRVVLIEDTRELQCAPRPDSTATRSIVSAINARGTVTTASWISCSIRRSAPIAEPEWIVPMPPGWPVPQAFSRSSASAPRTSPIGMRSGRRRNDERTRSDNEATPSLVRMATRFGASFWPAAMRITSAVPSPGESCTTQRRSRRGMRPRVSVSIAIAPL